MHSRLAINYGAATVRAILVAPGGSTTLHFDGAAEMSTAAHVSNTGIVTGAAAWRHAAADPDGLVVSPLRAGTGRVTVGGVEVEVVDLVAAALRQVAAEAQQVAGEPVDDVRMVVPAGWGPRRRTWLRHAARHAGLPVARLIEAPVAAIAHLDDTVAARANAGGPALVLDVGAGGEVTVVQHAAGGGEVLSTLADPDAGGDRIDAALIRALTGTDLADLPAEHRWPVLTNVRAARHALSEQVAVTMPVPGGQPPMVVNTQQVAEAAQPVFKRVGELAAQALGNADLTLDQVSGVYLIGAAAVTPGAGEMIASKLGATPQLTNSPQLAAVLGAADTDTTAVAGGVEEPLRLPPLHRLITLALPGLASLALYAHFVLSADFYNGTPDRPGVGYYVMANWGELAVAAVLAAITALQAAALFAALLDQRAPTRAGQAATGRISGGIAIAVAAGLATAGLYAITAAVFFNHPTADLLRWALLPVLPTAAIAALVAGLAWRRAAAPVGGWDGFLAFPASSMTTATAGILAVSLWWHGGLPAWLNDWTTVIGLTGGLLIGTAVACALVRHPAARLALTVPIGVFTTIISRSGPDIPAIIWAIAVAVWWAGHAWALVRTRPN
ncbi:Hsp70 family protein [Actinoplanes sp. NPDC049668]|uniref:Hsp70 family protein n=1 Tax=unclassified Actinoplanes TaxID=2626549 RepID=UPI0033A844DB